MEPLCDIDALLDAHNNAWNRHDVAAFTATLDPQAEIYEHPGQLQLKGTEAISAHFTQLWAKLPEMSVTLRRRIKLENHIVEEESIRIGGREAARDVAVYRVEHCLITRIDTIE